MNLSSKIVIGVVVALLPLFCLMADAEEASHIGIKVISTEVAASSAASSPNFTGGVNVMGRFQTDPPARVGGATVTFEPGARTAWHSHPIGQTLIILRGCGIVEQWGAPAHVFGPGDVIWIPPGVKHWHGAVPDEAMTHVAIAERLNESSVTWLEPVTQKQYLDAAGHRSR